MSNYNKISLSQIDVDALSDYVVAKKKLVYRDDTNDVSVVASNKAQDVEKVAGVRAENIAIAIDQNHRNTVQNALQLGGLNAEDYMTMTQGGSVMTKQGRMKTLYGDELQNLKDELYTLRQELAKGGFIEDRGEYTGYIDTFRANAPKHIAGVLAEAAPVAGARTNKIFIEDEDVFDALDVYDYIVLEAESLQAFAIKQIKEKNTNDRTLVLDSDIRSDIFNAEDGMKLLLSHGINDEGMFKFARAAELGMAEEENHTGLSDDTYKIVKHTFTPYTGFGYSFRVPEEKQGFVTSFEICARAHGTPGSMICYLIDARDLENFHSPEQAAADYALALENRDDSFHFFAASRPLTLSSAYGRRYIKFDFLQADETYPLMPQDEEDRIRYIAIIECIDCDRDNYYDIVFLQHKNSEGRFNDLELNNITYEYIRRPDNSLQLALVTDEETNASDMYYHIMTRSVVENEVEPDDSGLYSFHISSKDPVNKARVMLRIRKEGAWCTVTEEEVPKAFLSTVTVQNADADNGIRIVDELRLQTAIYNPLELRASASQISIQVPTIMGANITHIAGISDNSVTVAEPVVLKDGDPIYRMGYLVSLKARKVELVNDELVASDYTHFVLPLTEVFKDFRKLDKTSSDRLLFEANLFGEEATTEEYYNDFIVQIYWSNREISPYSDIRKAQMGAIKDIAVSFNQGF